MKILHIYDSDTGEKALSGVGSSPASVVSYISKSIVRKGHEVTILERKYITTEPSVEYMDNIRYVRLKAKKRAGIPYNEIKKFPLGHLRLILDGITFAVKIKEYLKENAFDVIHVHFPFSANILIILDRKLRNKMVYTAHVGEENRRFGFNSGKVIPLLLRFFSPDLFLMKRIRKTVVLNEPLRLRLIGKGFKKDEIIVIPNGVEVQKFNGLDTEQIRQKYGLRNINVLFVGLIIPRKGVEYLVKAATILSDMGYNINFILCGNINLDKDYVKNIYGYIENPKLNVKLIGFIPYEDLMKLYLACDLFILPSIEEGFGIALIDALAAGKSVIGTNVGGIPMQIKDGWNGFLVEPADEKQLAEKIKYLLDHPEERERMGKNSRRLAEEEFDWNMIADRYLEVYEKVAR